MSEPSSLRLRRSAADPILGVFYGALGGAAWSWQRSRKPGASMATPAQFAIEIAAIGGLIAGAVLAVVLTVIRRTSTSP